MKQQRRTTVVFSSLLIVLIAVLICGANAGGRGGDSSGQELSTFDYAKNADKSSVSVVMQIANIATLMPYSSQL